MLARLTDRGLRVLRRAARTHLRGIQEHFNGRPSQAQLRSVASALEIVTGCTNRTERGVDRVAPPRPV
jgi:hypothetical protein